MSVVRVVLRIMQHSCYLFVLTCSRALAVCRTIDRVTPPFMCFAASHRSIDHHGPSSKTAASWWRNPNICKLKEVVHANCWQLGSIHFAGSENSLVIETVHFHCACKRSTRVEHLDVARILFSCLFVQSDCVILPIIPFKFVIGQEFLHRQVFLLLIRQADCFCVRLSRALRMRQLFVWCEGEGALVAGAAAQIRK